MKKFLQEYKQFIIKGNVMNLAVGVIIGAAFQGIVTSLTTDILSPLIGVFMGQNFDSLELVALGATIRYGAFITSIINFLIMAFVVFILVRSINKLMALTEKPAAETEDDPPPRKCPYCRTEIDDDATRCPACTSELDELSESNESAESD